jgi:hypothetical protein
MSKPNGKRLKLTEMRRQAADALGTEPCMELELDNGEVVAVPHPLFMADEAQEKVNAAGSDTVAMAKAILGDEEHSRFIAAGGHSNDIMLAWRLMSQNIMDTLPDGNPTRSRR